MAGVWTIGPGSEPGQLEGTCAGEAERHVHRPWLGLSRVMGMKSCASHDIAGVLKHPIQICP